MTAWPRRTLGILAAAGTFAGLLGYWQWHFLYGLRELAHSGVFPSSPGLNRLVREFLIFGLDTRLMALHVGLVSGLLVLVFMAAHREFSMAAARTLAVVFALALCTIALLWYPLIRHVIPPSVRFSPNPYWEFEILSTCWLGAGLALTVLFCLRPSRVMPWLLILLSVGSLFGCVALAFLLSGPWLPPYVLSRSSMALRNLGFSLWPVVLAVSAAWLLRGTIGAQGAVWLLVVATACCYETWRLVLTQDYHIMSTWPPADAGTRFNLPLSGGFIVIEAVLAYLVWSRRRGLLEPQEHRGGFPVIQESKDASA
jgi:hypothetical protein